MVAVWSWLEMGSSSKLFNINCCWSASTSNVDMELRSSGITCFLFHVPQAYSKKFTHGSAWVFMADSSEEAVRTHSSVRQRLFRFAIMGPYNGGGARVEEETQLNCAKQATTTTTEVKQNCFKKSNCICILSLAKVCIVTAIIRSTFSSPVRRRV